MFIRLNWVTSDEVDNIRGGAHVMDLRATLVGPISELDRLQWALVRSGCLPKLLGLRFSKTKLIMRPSRYVHMHKRSPVDVPEAII